MKDTFPPLNVVFQADGLVNLIDPTEDGSGNVWAVLVHPMQIHAIAARLGLIRSVSATDADSVRTAGELQRDNDRHRRNLLRVRDNALSLQVDFAKNADWQHADLEHEMGRINALVELLDLACDDFSPSLCSEQSDAAAKLSPATPTAPAGQLALEGVV